MVLAQHRCHEKAEDPPAPCSPARSLNAQVSGLQAGVFLTSALPLHSACPTAAGSAASHRAPGGHLQAQAPAPRVSGPQEPSLQRGLGQCKEQPVVTQGCFQLCHQPGRVSGRSCS